MSLDRTRITLALPYNHDPRYAAWLESHMERVSEVYLPVHRSVGGTLRPWMGPDDAAAYRERLRPLAEVMSRHGLLANVILNLPIWDAKRDAIFGEIEAMRAIFGPATMVTLSDYPLACELRASFPDLRLGVSTAARVDSPEAARTWIEASGVESIVLSREINKRPGPVRAIRSLGVTVKMVLDDVCLHNCPAQLSHMALVATTDPIVPYETDCFMKSVREAKPWLVALKDVVPATLPRFDGLVDVAKLDGRADTLESIERRYALYLEATSYEHPKRYYVEPPEALDRMFACDQDCTACGWCAAHFVLKPDRAR